MPVPTLYLDTSVIGGYFDDEFCGPTRELWRLMEAGCLRFVTSAIMRRELAPAPQRVRELFTRTFHPGAVLDVTGEMEDLADAYLRHGILTQKYAEDALHVAVCTVAGIQHLASWNFKHFVNPTRKSAFNAINLLQGYPPVSIVSPQEFIYDAQDQEI